MPATSQIVERPSFTEKVIFKLRALRDRHVLKVPPRSAEPFVTHLPVLLGVGHLVQARRILEFGSGNHSSLAFLDRECFPHVEHVDSFENDPEWGASIAAKAAHDSRFRMQMLDGAVAQAVANVDLESYDMVFIDDSVTSAERSATIRAVVARVPTRAVVIVHDFEHPPYRHALRGMKHIVRMTALNPNTGVGWNHAALAQSNLRRLNDFVRLSGPSLPLNNPAELAKGISRCLGPVPAVC